MRSDWFKNLVPVYQPMRRKTKTICDLHTQFFPRFEHVARNLDWFIGLFAPTVICQINIIITLVLFYDTQLKTAL